VPILYGQLFNFDIMLVRDFDLNKWHSSPNTAPKLSKYF
jgi:hypothetical protein